MKLAAAAEAVFRGEQIRAVLKNYSVRESQVEMACSVSDLLELGGVAVLEAGTGVGKSFAYLIPAVLSGQAAVVSTATITLQDQLLEKDIPAVSSILGRRIDAVALKGRSNYLCLRKLSLRAGLAPPDLRRRIWECRGDLSRLDRAEDPSSISKLRGDSLDCLKSRCPDYQSCFYYKARSLARKASILVVNHHLLLSGIETGDLIPETWLLVADEAHALQKAALSTMGYVLNESILNGVIDAVDSSVTDGETKTRLLDSVRETAFLVGHVIRTSQGITDLDAGKIAPELQAVADSTDTLRESMEGTDDLAGACQILSALSRTALAIAVTESRDWCCYTEKTGNSPSLKCVPINPGAGLRERLYGNFPAVLLTSATLASNGSFSYSDSLLGVPEEAERRAFESPFDYASRSVLVLPDHSTDHNDHRGIALEAWNIARETAGILDGRTMILFTSYRNMELCCVQADENPLEGLPVFVQGRMNRSAILEGFRNDPRGVILGTASFWEGVDLPGELLKSLIIDRIPFPSPGHPLTRARMKYCEDQGRSSFHDIMIPEAATRLKQGAGRLIRSIGDSGAVFILDGRLRTAGYAQILLRSLPPFRRASVQEAMDFLREQAPSFRSNTIETGK